MKKTILLILIIISSANIFGQKINLKKSNSESIKIINENQENFTFIASIENLKFEKKATKNGEFCLLSNPLLFKTFNVGKPMLPVFSKLIEIPINANVEIKILSYDEEIIDLKDEGIVEKIIPAQPSLSKSSDPADIPFYIDENIYNENKFYKSEKFVNFEESGLMRATRIGRLEICPFEYNPVSNQLKVYSNIKIEVLFQDYDVNETKNLKKKYSSPYYQNFTNSYVLNSLHLNSKELIQQTPVEYVIISDRMFENQLVPFVEWKEFKGFNVTVAYTDEIGTTTNQIKTYLQNLYNSENPPTFVLFVGDVEQIPAWNGNEGFHVTDLYYCDYTGDMLPDVYYGRFSARNPAELQPQIDKTLMYEQYTMSDPSYIENQILVAGIDGGYAPTHANGQINYATDNYFNSEHDINPLTYLFNDEVNSTVMSSSNNNASNSIISYISNGVGFANYTAHCSANGWADPNFSISDVYSLENEGKYGLWIGNCCLSAKFDEGECFAEAAMRKENGGAVGDIGGSNSTYWDEDYWWSVGFKMGEITANPTYDETLLGFYDGIFHDKPNEINEPYSWYITQGQMVVCGNIAVEASSSDDNDYYWEIYHLMGDPSVCNYMRVPEQISVELNSETIIIGAESIEISTVPYGLAAVHQDGNRIAVVMTDAEGNATIDFSEPITGEEITIIATAQNKVPFIEDFQPISDNEPFVIIDSYTPQIVDYNSNVSVDVNFKNVALSGFDAINVVANISTENPYISFIDDSEVLGNISGNEIINIENAFAFDVTIGVEDQEEIIFDVLIEGNDGEYLWESEFEITINSPKLSGKYLKINEPSEELNFITEPIESIDFGEIYVYDIEVVGGNGLLDPAETVNIIFNAKNIGHASIFDAFGHLTTTSTYVTIENDEVYIEELLPDESFNSVFEIIIVPDTPEGTMAEFEFIFGDGIYQDTFMIFIPIGKIIEDFETGNFQTFNWQNGGDAYWTVTSDNPYDGIYCAISGDLLDEQTSELSIELENVSEGQTISFYYKISSEPDYDFFIFEIDGRSFIYESGEKNWTLFEYTFTETGNYTLKFIYVKDGSVYAGNDCAWIDNIDFPVQPTNSFPKSFSISAPTLPVWLEFSDIGYGYATISGIAPFINSVDNVVLEASNSSYTVTQEFDITTAQNTNIPEIDGLVKVFPNPVNEFLNIELGKIQGNVSVEIIDIRGKIISRYYLEKQNTEIDCREFEKGLYVIKFTINHQIFCKKIIVE